MSAAPIAATAVAEHALPVAAADGHRWTLLARVPDAPRQALLWLPALGVAARHYLPFAEALAAHGVAVFLHEWRGNGSSTLRPSRQCDWGYRALLQLDLPASQAAIARHGIAAPLLVGGHSLGGQLACCYASLQPQAFAALWLGASGTPH
uniref:alpha/beta fold hydrolase n=1 Tax=Xanthomonas sacchari TaxID=56458 RepID=UPI00026304A5